MPRLKNLDIQGFKSFADPLSFVFPTGITAVVGPNGSGKSNIADGVRWVLGEQRMTAIRGRSGDDMIFAGSGKRARSGLARVAITFDNSDNWLPLDYAEVTVERRTYRDGKTDYMLNGSKVRLKDLRDVLDRAGLGREAYLIIGQGLVDQVLALRPNERLALFEQAAGIAPYRTRREEALKRLDNTKGNLVRLYDIIGEIEPRLRRLKRQTERIEQHRDLSKELHSLQQTWYGYRWGRTIANLETSRQRVHYHEDRVLKAIEETDTLADTVTAQREQMITLRAKVAELHHESSTRHEVAAERQREFAVAQERRVQLQQRLEEAKSNLNPLQAAYDAEQVDITALNDVLGGVGTQLQERRDALNEADTIYRKIEAERHAILRQQAEAQSKALKQRHILADRQGRLTQAETRVQQIDQRVAELEKTAAATQEKRRTQQTHVAELHAASEKAEQRVLGLEREIAEVSESQTALQSEEQSLRSKLNREQSDLERIRTRIHTLERLHAEGAGLYAGVRTVISAVENGDLRGLPGTVASILKVPSDLERAIEAALGAQMQNVVAETWDHAQAAIEWLKRNRAGRATFLPLDNLREPDVIRAPRKQGVLGVACDLVGFDAKYKDVAEMLLGRAVVVDDLDTAKRIQRDLRGSFRIVTLEGEIVRSGGSVTGGRDKTSKNSGLLARERERRELPEKERTLAGQVHAIDVELRSARVKLSDLAVALNEARRNRKTAASDAQQKTRAYDKATRALETLINEYGWQQKRAEESREEKTKLIASRTSLAAEIAAAQTAIAGLEEKQQAFTVQLQDVDDGSAGNLVAERRTALALIEQEHQNQTVLLDSRNRELRRLNQQIQANKQRILSLTQELAALSERLGELRSQYGQARQAADELVGAIPPMETELTGMEQAVQSKDRGLRESREFLRETEHRLNQAEIERSRREDQLAALQREVEDTLGIVLSNLPDSVSVQHPLPMDAIVAQLPVVQELPEGLERQIRDLRTQIRRLEPINLAAKEEYDELQERYGFLSEQMQDLETASAQLREVISELDEMMDTMFGATFEAISQEFTKIFKLLFNGGTGKLALIDDGENPRAGVEITARPPGKRTSSLGLLSGGERTLTAVALLFSVMRVSPTAFCILDEVDAMLDEANVGRFRRMLRELSHHTQFIVITHNRSTVEEADTIYGVSMGDDSVSRVLSLDIQDLPASNFEH